MAHVKTDVEFEELYRERRLLVKWRMSRLWSLTTASVPLGAIKSEVFIRQDQPDAPTHIKKLSFGNEEERDTYLFAKQLELEGEGWRAEVED
jgi:hypothetical protein